MRSKAPVPVCARAPTDSQVNGARRRARTSVLATRPSATGELAARWVPAANGRLEMRWEWRAAPPIRIARSRGEDA